MDARNMDLLTFLQGPKQFQVPIFQRRYDWTKEECKQLWDDVLRVGQNEDIPSHFLGSIYSMKPDDRPYLRVPQWLVIDGQQRLTTISLLLSALGRTIEARKIDVGIDRERIDDYYLFNLREESELRYKQLLTQHDKETLVQLLEQGEASDYFSPLVTSYRFFDVLLKRANLVDLKAVYEGMRKLMIIDIVLNPQSDDPQLIFESLNSKGTELSQTDLIRNYILMGQDPNFQNKLYEDYWYPMEQDFGKEYDERFDLFIRDYLTLKTRQIPNKKKVYESFKRYIADKKHPGALEKTIAEIKRYSGHYVCIALLKEEDSEIRDCFEDIQDLKVEVAFPFLLGVYEDCRQKLIEKTDVIEILRLIESYVFRRAICDIPTNNLNKIFASLIGQINKNSYLQSLKTVFSQMTGNQRYPSDNEFKQDLLIKDVYNFDRCGYLLRKLENHRNSKEPVLLEYCTIERVMPEKLTEEWQAELGEDWRKTYETYLYTIGNLTLTGYNSELSNRPFKEKQEIPGGFRDSPLRLNRSLAEAERWDEIAIVDRAEMLSEKACEIWPDHGVPQEIVQEPRGDSTLADHHHLTGEMMDLFQQLRDHILNLDTSVSEQITKHYIAYIMNTTFVSIEPQARRLRLSLKLPFPDINDPEGSCRDLTNIGHLGLGDVGVGISSVDEVNYIMFLIRQAFERQIANQ